MTTPATEGTHTEARDWLARELRSHGLKADATTAILAAADTYAARAAAHARDGERERCVQLAEQRKALCLAPGDNYFGGLPTGMEPFAALLRQDQPAPITGYLIDGRVHHPADVQIIRQDQT